LKSTAYPLNPPAFQRQPILPINAVDNPQMGIDVLNVGKISLDSDVAVDVGTGTAGMSASYLLMPASAYIIVP